MASNPTFPKLALTRKNTSESLSAVIGKLVRDRDNGASRPGGASRIAVSRDMFDKLSRETGQDLIDADSVFQVLPDVELANQILCGSILSPKDMSSVDIDFTVANNDFDSELARALLGVVEDHFKGDYKINDRQEAILEEVLFTKGAYIQAVIPENNLDQMVNGNTRLSMEQYGAVLNRITQGLPMGFLGHPSVPAISMESFRQRSRDYENVKGSAKVVNNKGVEKTVSDVLLSGVTVTDNFDVLKVPSLRKGRRATKISHLMQRHHVSMESASKGLSPEDIDKLYNKSSGAELAQIITPQTFMNRESIGHPLVLKLPVEATIPVFVPGEPGEHIGYFVLLDQNGRPLQRRGDRDYYGELRQSFTANTRDNASEMVRQVREAMGATNDVSNFDLDQVQRAYGSILETDLVNRLRNGIYEEELSIGTTEELLRVMLYRSFKAKMTQLLYIPAELVVYMAFTYNEHGIGQTLLTQSKILSSMRSVLLFAETMSGVRNAIGRKKASITIDPHDPDPQKSISDIQGLILEASHRGFPLGSPDPAQTLDYLNRAGYDFNINMESEDYPATKVEFDDYNTQVNAGNPDLSDRLRRMHIAGMGLSPDWVDPQQAPEFAVSVVNNNLLMTRRVVRYQKRYTEFVTKFVQIYTQHSSILKRRLLEVLSGENRKKLSSELQRLTDDEVIEAFIRAIAVNLPAPDTTKTDLQLAAFEQFTNLLERSLEAYITEDLFPGEQLGGTNASEMVTLAKATIKAYYQRIWLEKNNVLPELDQLTQMEDGKATFNLLDIQTNHFNSLGTALHEYFKGIEELKKGWDKKYSESGEEANIDTDGIEPSDTEEPLDETGDELNQEEDTAQGDDLDALLDETPLEETVDETPPELEETPETEEEEALGDTEGEGEEPKPE